MTAEELFTEVLARRVHAEAVINSFREVAKAGLPSAAKVLSIRYAAFMQYMLTDEQYDKLFLDKEKFIASGSADLMASQMTEKAIRNANVSVDAASIVFAHAVVDDAALSYLKVTFLAAPAEWEGFVENKKVELRELKSKDPNRVFEEASLRKLEDLEWESLPKKLDLLHALCKPPQKFAPVNSYTYDRGRIERIDKLRHDLIHGAAFGQELAAAEGDLDYLLRTHSYMLSLVNERYGLRVDPLKMAQLVGGSVPPR